MIPARALRRRSPAAAAFGSALTRIVVLSGFAAVLGSALFVPRLAAASERQAPGLPNPVQMERDLLAVINQERASHGLPAVSPSSGLTGLARTHSAEMARLNLLTHASAMGKTLTDRLTDAGVLFSANGENVAQSWSAAAEAIHQSFMNSPGHRANVLNRDFDEVGIGIVRGRSNVYFVTEDFIGSLERRTDAEVRAMVLDVLDRARAAAGLPRVVLVDEAERTAGVFARERAADRKTPPVPAYFGEALLRLVVGPDTAMIADTIKGPDLARYGRAGIGVAFMRNAEYPGGAYVLCVLLLKDATSPGPDELARLRAVLAAANEVRTRHGLPRLELDAALAERADAIIARHKPGTAATTREDSGRDVFYAVFQKLDGISAPLRKRLEDPALRKIGISTVPIQTRDGTLLNYAVAVILAR